MINYSLSVIMGRALPHLIDGLKPVQRRILYSMYQSKNFHNKPTIKSANIVGTVMALYHGHGDTSIYDAAVQMGQKFKNNINLIYPQGK